jgi:hypothetical protein
MLNGLGFTHRALYLTPLDFRSKPVDRLLGEDIEAEHLNDDVLGRALDAIYDYGPDVLYPQLAAPAVNHLNLPCCFIWTRPVFTLMGSTTAMKKNKTA